MTVVIVTDSEIQQAPRTVLCRLAELAITDELLVVYGYHKHRSAPGRNTLVADLRDLLPRHDIVALPLGSHANGLGPALALLDELMEIGSLPILVTPAPTVDDVAAALRGFLRADRLLRVAATGRTVDLSRSDRPRRWTR